MRAECRRRRARAGTPPATQRQAPLPLHRKGFVHRDIKVNNFMIDRNDKAKLVYIIDFTPSSSPRCSCLRKGAVHS